MGCNTHAVHTGRPLPLGLTLCGVSARASAGGWQHVHSRHPKISITFQGYILQETDLHVSVHRGFTGAHPVLLLDVS
jgi:hypothetical protein